MNYPILPETRARIGAFLPSVTLARSQPSQTNGIAHRQRPPTKWANIANIGGECFSSQNPLHRAWLLHSFTLCKPSLTLSAL